MAHPFLGFRCEECDTQQDTMPVAVKATLSGVVASSMFSWRTRSTGGAFPASTSLFPGRVNRADGFCTLSSRPVETSRRHSVPPAPLLVLSTRILRVRPEDTGLRSAIKRHKTAQIQQAVYTQNVRRML